MLGVSLLGAAITQAKRADPTPTKVWRVAFRSSPASYVALDSEALARWRYEFHFPPSLDADCPDFGERHTAATGNRTVIYIELAPMWLLAPDGAIAATAAALEIIEGYGFSARHIERTLGRGTAF